MLGLIKRYAVAAPLRLAQTLRPLLPSGGVLAFTNSILGSVELGLSPELGLYGASKAALNSIGDAMRMELGPLGICVNAICPGFFPSKMTAGLLQALGEDKLAAAAPLQRLGDDEDLKGAAVLFASDAGKHITGQWLAVDGGVSVVTGG